MGSSPTECDGILSSEWLTGVGTRTQPIRHATRSIPRTVGGSRLNFYLGCYIVMIKACHKASPSRIVIVEAKPNPSSLGREGLSFLRTVDGSRLILYPTYHGADTKKVAMVEGRTGG